MKLFPSAVSVLSTQNTKHDNQDYYVCSFFVIFQLDYSILNWLVGNKMQLAPAKSEGVIFKGTSRRKHVKFDGGSTASGDYCYIPYRPPSASKRCIHGNCGLPYKTTAECVTLEDEKVKNVINAQ